MAQTKDFLMKSKNKDGEYDILYPITKTKNVTTEEQIVVKSSNNIGSFKNGDVIDAGTSTTEILKKLLQQRIAATYTKPSTSISVVAGSEAGKYEAGTSLSPTIRSTFKQNDAGSITSHEIKQNGTVVLTGTNAIENFTPTTAITLGDTSLTFNSTVIYGAGEIKNDNFGDPSPTGAIASGTSNSSNITYTPYRKYFYTSDSVATPAADSDSVRAFKKSSTDSASVGTTFTIDVAQGDTRVSFAYPASLDDVSSVKYVEMGNDESKMFFNKTTVSVEGANKYNGIDYKVYTYIPEQAFPSAMTFVVTI